VTISRDGTALVEAGTQEIGTGTYTVMQQVAADTLGMAFDKVSVRIGDTRLPYSHASMGSATMANAGASIMLAAKAAREKAVALAIGGESAPFVGAAAGDVLVSDGALTLVGRNARITYSDLLTRNKLSTLVGDGRYDPVEETKGPKAIFSFSALFVEVRVDPDLGLIRLNRLVGAYDAGRIINPKTARSQAIGGVIWASARLSSSSQKPTRRWGAFLHRNLSGYLVPTNADIPQLDVLFVGEFDDEASPIGAKGLRAHGSLGRACDC
jgi:xanthine dehydrogenase YagR molybdenum-binding subunit